MIRTMTAEHALQGRSYVKSAGTGTAHWTTNFLGERSTQVKDEPQAMLIEMSANETIISHFHAVDQFQVFVAGSGTLARHSAQPLTLQYADHHTGYGPIIAGPQGLSYFVLRAKTDSGTVYLDRPGYREKLKPSKKRNRLSKPVTLSTEPVLLTRGPAALEPLLDEKDCTDGIGAFMLRVGPEHDVTGPDSRGTGGQFYLVVNGSLECAGKHYPAWSTIFVDPAQAPLAIRSGPKGVEAMIMNFASHLSE